MLLYHFYIVRETCAAKIVKFTHIESANNIADVLTKQFGSDVFHNLIKPLLLRQHIYVKRQDESNKVIDKKRKQKRYGENQHNA